ncbi:MAG TPA: hypothetical protein VLR47_10550, partial [Rhodospirillales bacterium]|nr:hypothetical protein [Rhodospirillales bacterium]
APSRGTTCRTTGAKGRSHLLDMENKGATVPDDDNLLGGIPVAVDTTAEEPFFSSLLGINRKSQS